MEKLRAALADALTNLNSAIDAADQEAARIYAHVLKALHELIS